MLKSGIFLIEMPVCRSATLTKRHYNVGVFLTVMAKILRTAILKNIWTAACENFPFMFVWMFFYMNK